MSGRFSDDLDLVSPEDYLPETVQTLLAHLHLENEPRHSQEAGIRAWLKTHSPGPTLVFTLRSNGFGNLVDRRATG